mgnify:CR=1 FL=1
MNLILASASPRRQELLKLFGLPFVVRVADIDETMDTAKAPCDEVSRVSRCKAVAVPSQAGDVVIAADTIVVCEGRVLGKPRDEADAARMMYMLQGRTHTVASGIAVWHKGRTVTAHELTEVSFAPMTEEEIFAYVATGESFGKAGGYAIQGHAARYITGIRGDYFNVVGLPVRRLYETLKLVFGIHL